jgi:adenosyl cobinamide kinase/adenosyl cobinamide phosphate guanylyltransferase
LIVLVLGGARSGKSAVAERLVAGLSMVAPVTYVATMRLSGLGDGAADPDLVARVRAHQARRPDDWRTVEAGDDLAGVLLECVGTVLVDSLGPWVAGAFVGDGDGDGVGPAAAETLRLCSALRERTGDTVVVSEEVGFGVHPSSGEGRRFRDLLGSLNQAVSSVADEVYFVIAGRAMRLPDVPGLTGPPGTF